MTKQWKLAIAGGVTVVACMVLVGGTSLLTDNLLWRLLALAASICIGYFTYETADVLKAIPIAAQKTRSDFLALAETLGSFATGTYGRVREWFAKPHPFWYTGFVLGISLWASFFLQDIRNGHFAESPAIEMIGALVVAPFVPVAFAALLFILAWAGAFVEGKELIKPDPFGGAMFEPVGYGAAYRYMIMGIGVGGSMVGAFVVHLVKLVHSRERLVVTAYGNTIGLVLMAGYWLWGPADSGALHYLLLLLFGGIVGMAAVSFGTRYVAPRFGYRFLPQS
ncbi:MAG: hypothetical protein AAB919_02430 [Patescibacteria group bacterium]